MFSLLYRSLLSFHTISQTTFIIYVDVNIDILLPFPNSICWVYVDCFHLLHRYDRKIIEITGVDPRIQDIYDKNDKIRFCLDIMIERWITLLFVSVSEACDQAHQNTISRKYFLSLLFTF
jgi:hypothetical protein